MKAAAQVKPAAMLPHVDQVVFLAICKAERSLQCLVDQRIADEHWDEVDVYVHFGVELALSHLSRMKSMVFGADCAFDQEWFKAAGALNLGKAVFSRKDCAYFRMLEGACEMFDQLAGLVEFSEKAA